MGSASSSLELADLNTGAASINCTFPMDDKLVDLYEERVYHINPRVRRARQMPVGLLLDDRVLAVDDDPHMGEFMDWLNQTPNRYLKGAKLYQAGGHEIYFGSYFAEQQGPPEEWHHRAHKHIIPHLMNYIQVGKILSGGKLNNELTGCQSLVSERPFALLNRSANIIECSAGFEDVLRTRKLLTVNDRKLVAIEPRHRLALERFLRSALGENRLVEAPMPIRIASSTSSRGIVLRAVPIEPSNDVFDIFRPKALITITDLDRQPSLGPGDMMVLFDLTYREAQVASLIGAGRSTGRAALSLGVTEYTVRHHLKAVFGKMGISRQADLVAIAFRLG